jgi:nucleoside-diphosphate-sugar epimerase
MRVLVTGAAGFIGSHLRSALLARGQLSDASGKPQGISELIVADTVPIACAAADGDIPIRTETGDFCDPAFLRRLVGSGVDSVFHLAATLTIDAETNFARGLQVNVHGLMQLLEICRAQARPPRFVFSSSIAAFGGPLPKTVDDTAAQTPQTSYGTHKAIVELLLNDYSRHGFIDARALRLPFVLIRPGATSPAVSDRVAAIVREPLLGLDVVCPLAPETRIPVASARRVATALLATHDLPAASFGHTRAMNLPSLTVSIGEMVEALQRFGQTRQLGRITWEADARLQAVVDGWPSNFVSERASRNGICADADFDEIIRAFVEDYLPTQ